MRVRGELFEVQCPKEYKQGEWGSQRRWERLGEIWAYLYPARSANRVEGGREEDRITHIVTTRFRDDIKPGMRLHQEGRVLEIKTCYDKDNRQHTLSCKCVEVKPLVNAIHSEGA
ncbi:MAG: phage head closure protein [Parvibaculales bacterium]